MSSKQLVMMQSMGNSERCWAKLISRFGKVTLIQQGMVQHVESWENGVLTFNGPEINVHRTRLLDEASLSIITMWRSLARFKEQMRSERADIIIAANYSMGLPALWLRKIRRARVVVVFLTDYFPVRGPLLVRLRRMVTLALTRFCARHADEVWSVSPRIPFMQENKKSFVVPICLENHRAPASDRKEIGYIGYPSPDHALETLFEICKRHRFRLNIVGNSPYLDSIKHLAPEDTRFYGMLIDADAINEIFSRCFCGYAIYKQTGPNSYSYYGIPSKTFSYLASNTPFITTLTAHFTQEISNYGVGRVVNPDPKEIEQAILELENQFPKYYQAIDAFRATWNKQVEQFHLERLAAHDVA